MKDSSGSAIRVRWGLDGLVDWTGPRRDVFPMLLPPRVHRHNLNGLIRLGSQCCLAVHGFQYLDLYMILDLGPIDISKPQKKNTCRGSYHQHVPKFPWTGEGASVYRYGPMPGTCKSQATVVVGR